MNKLSKNFKLLVVQHVPGYFINGLTSVIFIWIILEITRSPFYASLIGVIALLPFMFSIFSGYYVSRINEKKRFIILLSIFRIIIFISMLIIFLTKNKIYEFVYLFTGLVILGMLSSLSSIISTTWEKEFMENNYQKNVAILNTLSAIINLSGYIIGGIMTSVSIYYSLLIIIIASIISSIPLFLIKPKYENVNYEKHSFSEGITYIKKHTLLYKVIKIELIDYLAGGALLAVIEVLIKFNYNASSFLLTLLIVFAFGGKTFGSFFAGKIKGNARVIYILTESLVAILIFMIPVIVLYSSFIYLLPDFFLMTFLSDIIDNINSVVMYNEIETDYMPQVSGSMRTMLTLPYFLSGIIMGLIMQFISVYAAFYTMFIISVIVIILVLNTHELKNFKMGVNE